MSGQLRRNGVDSVISMFLISALLLFWSSGAVIAQEGESRAEGEWQPSPPSQVDAAWDGPARDPRSAGSLAASKKAVRKLATATTAKKPIKRVNVNEAGATSQTPPVKTPSPGTKLTPPEIYKSLLRSVVWLHYDRDDKASTWGTGWVLDVKQRLIVTNQHVVKNYPQMTADFPQRANGRLVTEPEYYRKNKTGRVAKVISSDSDKDLALLQVEELPKDAMELKLAKESSMAGEVVYTVGSLPQGSEGLWIFTSGTVRQVYRRHIATGGSVQTLEGQMPINPGNSGGAVVNEFGEVVAVCEGVMKEVSLVSMHVDVSEVASFIAASMPLVAPTTWAAFNDRGMNHYRANRLTLAFDDCTAAIRLNKDVTMPWSNRGWVHLTMNQLNEAVSDFNQAIALDAKNVFAHRGLGRALVAKNRLTEAMSEYETVLRIDPKQADAYYDRATLYLRQQRRDLALADLNKAIELKAENGWYYASRAEIHWAEGRDKPGMDDIQTAIKLDPKNDWNHTTLGRRFVALGKYDLALSEFSRAIVMNDRNAWNFAARGDLYKFLKRFDDAIRDYTVAIELTPNDVGLKNNLGNIYFDLNKFDLAIQQYSKGLEIDPNDHLCLSNRGNCYRLQEKYDLAMKDLDRAIEARPDFGSPYYIRGLIYLAKGNKDAAKANYAKAAAAEPDRFQHMRSYYIVLVNRANEPVTAHLYYRMVTSAGKSVWRPTTPGEGGRSRKVVLDAGKAYLVLTKGVREVPMPNSLAWQTLPPRLPDVDPALMFTATRMRIWAEWQVSKKQHTPYKDKDLIMAPKEGYIGTDFRSKTYMYTFY